MDVCSLQVNKFCLYLHILQILDPSWVPSTIHRPLMKQKPFYDDEKHWLLKTSNSISFMFFAKTKSKKIVIYLQDKLDFSWYIHCILTCWIQNIQWMRLAEFLSVIADWNSVSWYKGCTSWPFFAKFWKRTYNVRYRIMISSNMNCFKEDRISLIGDLEKKHQSHH